MKNRQYKNSLHSAFTMIELIFVIVVLGILSAIALPKFGGVKNQADISKARADVSAIRSAIMSERQSQLIKGVNIYIPKLSANGTTLFTGDGAGRTLLTYGIVAGATATTEGRWRATDATFNNYQFYTNGTAVPFTYNNVTGLFTCNRTAAGTAGTLCKQIID